MTVIRNSLFVIRDSLRKTQSGEIATVLTLISVGLMLMGVVVGNVAVQQTTRTQSKAAENQCAAGQWECDNSNGTARCADAAEQKQWTDIGAGISQWADAVKSTGQGDCINYYTSNLTSAPKLATGFRLCTKDEEKNAKSQIYSIIKPQGCACDNVNKKIVRWLYNRYDPWQQEQKCDTEPYTAEDSKCEQILKDAGQTCNFSSQPAAPPAATNTCTPGFDQQICALPDAPYVKNSSNGCNIIINSPATGCSPGTNCYKCQKMVNNPPPCTGTCKNTCDPDTQTVDTSKSCVSQGGGNCCVPKTASPSEIDCMAYSSVTECRTKTNCTLDCTSCTIIGGGSGFRCPSTPPPANPPPGNQTPGCAQITKVSYTADHSPVEKGDNMTCNVELIPDPNNPADINTIACGWSKNGGWPMRGNRWENVNCSGNTCTFGIQMDPDMDPNAIYELVAFDMHWDCGPGKGKSTTLNIAGGKTIPKQPGCINECCGKPDGYGFGSNFDEQCDPNYKGGRWVIIEGGCKDQKPTFKPGSATCDACDPAKERIRPAQASSTQRNEATPGGCDNPTGQNVCSLSKSFQTPSLSNSCTQCIMSKSPLLRQQFDKDNQTFCTNQQLANYWCNGGVSETGKNQCKKQFIDDQCKTECAAPPDGKQCPLTSNQDPALSDACGACVFRAAGLATSDPFKDKVNVCTPNQISTYWCNGGLGNEKSKKDCAGFKNGFCDSVCNPKASTTGGSQDCNPFECPNDKNKKFSVKNRQLFNSGDCSGNPVTSYSSICGGSIGDGCDLVSGGNGKGKCVADASPPQCTGSGYTGRAFPRWGPSNNDVDIPLCTAQNKNLCCEPNTGPKGGFTPNPLPVISQTPSSGQQGDCKIELNPSTPSENDKITVKVTTDNSSYKNAGNIKLSLDGNDNFQNKYFENAQAGLWTYKPSDVLLPGNHTFTFSVNCDKNCTQCGSRTFPVTKTGSSSTSALNCSQKIKDSIPSKCSSCVNDKLEKKPEQLAKCSDLSQNVNIYCTDGKNSADCYSAFDKCPDEEKEKAEDKIKCRKAERSLLLTPQSYDNESYNTVIAGVKAGQINAIYTSLYVLNATRVPGLQRLYCDPFKGQCDFYWQQQVGT